VNSHRPADPDIDAKLSSIEDLWEEAKGWRFVPNRNFAKRFWRVCDHHDWSDILHVVVVWIERANTPGYLLRVLETPDRYTQIETNAEVKRCREVEGHSQESSDLNPFLSGSRHPNSRMQNERGQSGMNRTSDGSVRIGEVMTQFDLTSPGSQENSQDVGYWDISADHQSGNDASKTETTPQPTTHTTSHPTGRSGPNAK
tara:strand:- start:344 stop:943 length:600 start_codon:yes stop_codon:yes gene_type:complete